MFMASALSFIAMCLPELIKSEQRMQLLVFCETLQVGHTKEFAVSGLLFVEQPTSKVMRAVHVGL
jgi:hypothetical protein